MYICLSKSTKPYQLVPCIFILWVWIPPRETGRRYNRRKIWPTLPCPDCFMTMLWMVPPPFHYLLFSILFLSHLSILFLSQALAIFFAALPWKNSAAISLDVSQLQNMENQFWVLSSICVQKNGMLTILFINC